MACSSTAPNRHVGIQPDIPCVRGLFAGISAKLLDHGRTGRRHQGRRTRRVGGAPAAGNILADWGADVVKIEPPTGDPARMFRWMLGGHLRANPPFETIRLGEHSIADMLDSLSQDAENFADLFDGKYVADSVQDQFREPFNTALILLTVLVAEHLRGHDLGAWLAAEVIARMGSVSDTLVLLYPHPAGETRAIVNTCGSRSSSSMRPPS